MPSNCFNRLSFLHYSWNLSFFPLLREKNHLTFLLFFNSFFLPLILTLFPILSILFHLSAYLSLFVFPCFLFFIFFHFFIIRISLSLSLSHVHFCSHAFFSLSLSLHSRICSFTHSLRLAYNFLPVLYITTTLW